MARPMPPANLFTNSTKELLHNETGSDFKIVTNSRTFHVHKFVLSTRSEYFRGLFAHQDFAENQSGVLDLTTDNDVEEDVMNAFLTALYTDDYQLGDVPDRVTNTDEATAILELHVSISKLANRFLAHGIDDVIGAKLFSKLNSLNSIFRSGFGHTYRALRADKPFLDATLTIYKNAEPSGSKKARYLIAGLFVDAMHRMKHDQTVMSCLRSNSELCAEMLEEYLYGHARVRCWRCGTITRINPACVSSTEISCSCGQKRTFSEGSITWYQQPS